MVSKDKDKDRISGALEIIKGRMFWISDNKPPKCKTSQAFYFCIDDNLVYEPFCDDFGPLNLAMTHKYCTEVDKILGNPDYSKHKLYHYTSLDYKKRANAAYLLGAYLVICRGFTAKDAFKFFEDINPPFVPFRDAINGECTYACNIIDCLRGLECAIKLKWYDHSTFNVKQYEEYERVDNGDMNWIIPGKFIAFSSPSNSQYDQEGYRTFTPEDYVPIFKKWHISLVIRLNKETYDSKKFLKSGIKHLELFFADGSVPKIVSF